MEEQFDQQPLPENNEPGDEDFELSHSDKLVGVFTEPGKTFEKITKAEAKASDWLIPLFLSLIVAIIANVAMMSNQTIKYTLQQKQIAKTEKMFDKMVESGSMSKEQKEKSLEQAREMMDKTAGMQTVLTAVGILVGGVVIFFLVSGIFFLFAKFILKDDGSYMHSLSAYGLVHYITIIQIIVMTILAFVFDRFLQDTSVASLINWDTSTFIGWALSKLDIFSIWFFAVLAIAYAKVFKAENTGKYFAMFFGLWLGFSLLVFGAGQIFPFMSMFGM